MDFARKQLEKYGWTDGKGLGKHENGIADALKPKIKRSVTGVGHNAAQDFTEHWWTTLYNKAASNVEVEHENGKTKKIKTKDNKEFEITNSTWKLHRKPKDQVENGEYKDFFVKTAVLANGGSKVEKLRESDSEEEPQEKKDVFKMTDEELFAACGGRTAHKGARFGLKATGKLARIKQQEENLLNLNKYNGYSHAKKHKLKNTSDAINDDSNVLEESEISKIKKKRKKNKKNDRKDPKIIEDQEVSDSQVNMEDLLQDLKGSNLKLDSENVSNIADNDAETSEALKTSKRKKKKSLELVNSSESVVESTNLEEETELKCKKKSKRKLGKRNKE